MEDPKKALGVDYIYIKEDTEVEETTIADAITISYPVRRNIISIINLDAN
jgi:hypothetical protein